MRKVIIGVTSIILCLSIGLCGYFFMEYRGCYGGNSKKDIKKVEENDDL